MNLTKRGEYALRAVINLGIATELGRRQVPLSELASGDNLPIKFIEQIFSELRQAGYVDSKRGKYGGYFLSRPSSEIRIGDIVRLIDGPLAPIACASQTAYRKCTCPDEDHCGLRMIMIDVRNAISDILDRYSVHDVVQVTLRKLERDQVTHFLMTEKQESESGTQVVNPADGFLAALKNL